MASRRKNQLAALMFARPESGPSFSANVEGLDLSGAPAWQSNGGPNRGHPARSLPFTLEVDLGGVQGSISQIHLVGVFALFGGVAEESMGTLGASVHLVADRDVVFRQDLLNGRHYGDAREVTPIDRSSGDGTLLRTVGSAEIGGAPARVDLLSIETGEVEADKLRFKDLGSPASFLIFDIFAEFSPAPGCPFAAGSGGVALAEIGSIVRMGDRNRFNRALEQLERSLLVSTDLDEARGEALTFLAVATSATMEMGGTRAMHRVQLDAARKLDKLNTLEEIASYARAKVDEVCGFRFKELQSPSGHLVDRALAIVDRNFARNLTDATVAAQLGLSTSHFRFLFKEATGQPFHKYLMALRLEKARQMLIDQDLPVSEVAKAVGFGALSHFSRAFAHRFSVSPTSLRRSAE